MYHSGETVFLFVFLHLFYIVIVDTCRSTKVNEVLLYASIFYLFIELGLSSNKKNKMGKKVCL